MSRTQAQSFDYVAVGHVTVDVLLDAEGGPRRQPGGGALYSGLQAARLGLRTLILTRGEPAELRRLLKPFAGEIAVEISPSDQTTTLETRGEGSARRQRLLAWAGPIPKLELPDDVTLAQGAILHLAPVAQETVSLWSAQAARSQAADRAHRLTSGAKLVCLTPQGLVRRWSGDGEIVSCDLDPSTLSPHIDAAVISKAERESCEPLFEHVPIVAVTAGEGATSVHVASGGESLVEPLRVAGPHDDLGAGDVFAAAFFIALRDGLGPLEAATRGNAAAAVRIGGYGPGAIGAREAIERMLM